MGHSRSPRTRCVRVMYTRPIAKSTVCAMSLFGIAATMKATTFLWAETDQTCESDCG